ncbi:hypothetical protein Pmani_032002 [Petrolisthes manimaculis]|uniref:Uncharacterized protein n=1 Tax=Petrolisthes manimaculis TaxID=1843537 RepID=A0AAE1NUJ8_9EUCA|nr:hypothetical protein Pmani_032002 [Petrolisthes manimaculis]
MPESSAVKKKRQRHFWKWITYTKKLPRGALQDRALANRLRSEHSRAFPSLYSAVKSIDAKESIHLFHCKLLRFNQSLKEGDPEYCDAKFNELELFDREITPERFEAFLKHYLSGHSSFVKHGGRSDHRIYQMHYLDRAFNAFKCGRRPINKYMKRMMMKKKKEEKTQQSIVSEQPTVPEQLIKPQTPKEGGTRRRTREATGRGEGATEKREKTKERREETKERRLID